MANHIEFVVVVALAVATVFFLFFILFNLFPFFYITYYVHLFCNHVGGFVAALSVSVAAITASDLLLQFHILLCYAFLRHEFI